MAFCAWCGNQVPTASYAACPRCGNPTNGAQRIAGSSSGSQSAGLIIGLVIGFFVLIAVIGILAAIAIPNLLTAMSRSKQKRTMADVRMLGTATEAYQTDKDVYPPANSVDELKPLLTPTYARSLPTLDGWGTPMKYECWPAGQCQTYAFGSAGGDKKWEHESLQEYSSETKTDKFDCDIVYSNNKFVQYPDGTQTGGQ